MVNKYEPQQGDIVWVSFDNTKGHEQQGKRPALVVSRDHYNKKVGMALMCPITSQQKGYPLEVKLQDSETKGVVLADQVKSLDWQERNVKLKEQASLSVVKKVIDKITLLMRE